jgi:hypothetical protein
MGLADAARREQREWPPGLRRQQRQVTGGDGRPAYLDVVEGGHAALSCVVVKAAIAAGVGMGDKGW